MANPNTFLVARFKGEKMEKVRTELRINHTRDSDTHRDSAVRKFIGRPSISGLNCPHIFVEYPRGHRLAGQVFRRFRFNVEIPVTSRKKTLPLLKLVYYTADGRRHANTHRTPGAPCAGRIPASHARRPVARPFADSGDRPANRR